MENVLNDEMFSNGENMLEMKVIIVVNDVMNMVLVVWEYIWENWLIRFG